MLEFLKFKFILQGEEMKTSIHSIKRERGGGGGIPNLQDL